MKIKNLFVLITVALLMSANVSAYSVPDEYKHMQMSEDELFHLASNHKNEAWAFII